MTASAGWFGPPERPVFGWVHRPPGSAARVAVVLCASMGLEAAVSYSVLRLLAEDLAAQGALVVRVDYDGTGDSAGRDDDPHRVAAWLRSLGAAVDLARQETGAPLALVGLQLGALLAAHWARETTTAEVDSLVLWDAPRSGSRYLREQQTRHVVSVEDRRAADGGFHALGFTLAPDAVAELSGVQLVTAPTLPARRVLNVVRPDGPRLPASTTTRTGRPVDQLTDDDLENLTLRQILPLTTLSAIREWLLAEYPDPVPVRDPVVLADELRLDAATEHVVQIGPDRLFGVVTRPSRPVASPVVVMAPESHNPHSGLPRMWTDLARLLAGDGITSVRFDVSGSGDSQPRPGTHAHVVARTEHVDDLVTVVHELAAGEKRDAVLIGTCSGAYLCMEAALRVRPLGVALINPAFTIIPPEGPVSTQRGARQASRPLLDALVGRRVGQVARRYSPVLSRDPTADWDRWFEAGFWHPALVRRWGTKPEIVWRVINRTFLARHPADVLAQIARQGSAVLVISGDEEYATTTLGRRAALARLAETTSLRVEHRPELDHSVLRAGEKKAVMSALRRFVLDLTT